jgi:hypothetical protein
MVLHRCQRLAEKSGTDAVQGNVVPRDHREPHQGREAMPDTDMVASVVLRNTFDQTGAPNARHDIPDMSAG